MVAKYIDATRTLSLRGDERTSRFVGFTLRLLYLDRYITPDANVYKRRNPRTLPCREGKGCSPRSWYFTLPCGQPLHSAQLLFSLPCGQGLQSAQVSFRFPCEHRLLFPIPQHPPSLQRTLLQGYPHVIAGALGNLSRNLLGPSPGHVWQSR